jgi:hypothetical protein
VFVPPLILLPFLIGLAIYRLYQLPRRLRSGQLRFSPRHRPFLPLFTTAAYLTLLAYTSGLLVAIARTVLNANFSIPGLAPELYAVAAYPFVYLGAEWVFYHGLKPIEMSNR